MSRTYALSDIHGRLDKLDRLGRAMPQRTPRTMHAKFIFLGDYIDRGPDSRGVIEYLIDFQRRAARRMSSAFAAIMRTSRWPRSMIPARSTNGWSTNSGDTTLRELWR